MAHTCDIVIFGAGVAGLWLANTLKRAGYNVIVIEKNKIGAGQSLASQGMIHGGQKYTLEGKVTNHALSAAKMPERWEACFGGYGEIDLTSVKIISDNQVMWPAGSILSDVAVFGAAKVVNAETTKLDDEDIPEALQHLRGKKSPVYSLPEKVVDTRSLLLALSKNLQGRILQGSITEILPDGQAAVDGQVLRAQLIVFTAGTGNEDVFRLMNITGSHTQRRPLRQIMVRHLPEALFGHGITAAPKPRVTVTSHKEDSGYVWYLGGNLAEESATMDETAAIAFAQKEMAEIFPHIDWTTKEWATWQGDRAEPLDEKGQLPAAPFLHQRGKILLAWPVKMTFAPALSDHLFNWLKDKNIYPLVKDELPPLPTADIAGFPWESAIWQKTG
jgi:glycine/D-amino acid oxidase-like deaminating enzyme